jgi:hypothetical protein
MLRLPLTPAALALALLLPLSACGSKKEPPTGDKPTATAANETRARPGDQPPATDKAPASAEKAPASGATSAGTGISATAAGSGADKPSGACGEYRATIERLAQCGEGLPLATRDALRANFEREWAAWEQASAAQKTSLELACKRAADNVKVAASTACGW